jgi:hypothetical protein
MRLVSFIAFFIFLLSSDSFAQVAEKLAFKYRCIPTSTNSYLIEITNAGFIFKKTEKVADNNKRIIHVDSSTYLHAFDARERIFFDSIIQVHKLDSAGLYQTRATDWGALWEIEIQRNDIKYTIDLPNYNNAGLTSLLCFITCLIPEKEFPVFFCVDRCQ